MTTTLEADVDWKRVCTVDEIPILGSRVVNSPAHGAIAVFRNGDGEVFALRDRCPHKAGPLSQGIVHGKTVTCPLHSWKIQLEDGQAVAPDVGCTKHFPCKVEDGAVFLQL
ncbi:MAG: nitrite reductase small subunit NirD [Zoogloeaceae bacterium]|nr:nitrite reductase small subunit NirD [Zoogloeaceae bacterium]